MRDTWIDAAMGVVAVITGFAVADSIRRNADARVMREFHAVLHDGRTFGFPYLWES